MANKKDFDTFWNEAGIEEIIMEGEEYVTLSKTTLRNVMWMTYQKGIDTERNGWLDKASQIERLLYDGNQ
jgi:hypothetical protein